MGTRLYPITQDVTVLEQLAGVDPGTYDRMKWVETTVTDLETRWQILSSDSQLEAMYNFELFGWGKLRSPVYRLLEKLDLDTVCGQVLDIELAYHILELQDVELQIPLSKFAQVGGVTWS